MSRLRGGESCALSHTRHKQSSINDTTIQWENIYFVKSKRNVHLLPTFKGNITIIRVRTGPCLWLNTQIPINYLQCSAFEVFPLVPLSVSAIPDTETTKTRQSILVTFCVTKIQNKLGEQNKNYIE